METAEAARRWADVWQTAWPARDLEAIAAMYAEHAKYRALAFRPPDLGVAGVRDYLTRTFATESHIVCRFGTPVVQGDRAAVEWWASWDENDAPVTLAGATLLTFDSSGQIIDHRDYWNDATGRVRPYDGFVPDGSPG
jgi:hypothetical protein